MQQPDKVSSRKKFLVWGGAALASLTAFKLFTGLRKNSSSQNKGELTTVKMLTQDGKLVEVDADKLFCGKRKKISNEQLKNWITKNSIKNNGDLK